ncbi:MAG: hypothetical protein HXY20_04590 [Acidobacteria bacterium]|nr:hypothetical protein [Acidobacteriota bacterium]
MDLSTLLPAVPANRFDTLLPPLLICMEVMRLSDYILEEIIAMRRRPLISKALVN